MIEAANNQSRAACGGKRLYDPSGGRPRPKTFGLHIVKPHPARKRLNTGSPLECVRGVPLADLGGTPEQRYTRMAEHPYMPVRTATTRTLAMNIVFFKWK